MEFTEERTPPLPQNNQNLISEPKGIKMINFGDIRRKDITSPKDLEVKSVEISKGSHDKNNLFVPQKLFLQSSEVSQAYKANSNLKCWADNKSALSSEEIYENILFNVNSHCKNGAKNEKNFVNEKEEKRKSPEIEVRQEDNKTVVKISIKNTPSPVHELENNVFNANIYENGYVGRNGFIFSPSSDTCRIENNENSQITLGKLYENLPERSFPEAVSDECLYENLSEKKRYFEPKPITKANHDKLNEGNSKCNQVYENDFELTKNKTRKIKNSIEHEKRNDDSYEIIENNCPLQNEDNPFGNGQKSVTVERRKSEKADELKKSSIADLKLLKSDHFSDFKCSSDTVDSDTCSDVEGFCLVNNIRKGISGLTTKNLHNNEVKKNEPGHKRAESLTSSGVGIDSEESDDENSNISCDSLNSSDPYLQSNSEDNGYHTPNSEDKLGSPVEGISYENMLKRTSEENKEKKHVDFNNKVPKETEVIKQQPYFYVSDFQEYENVNIFIETYDAFKRNTSPPPPPPPPSNPDNTNDNSNSSISSSNVRLSSTYPNGESHRKINFAVSQAIFSISEKSKPKKGLVEEKTYEERKNNVKSTNVNKVCAMEVDTDKFYKFHLTEKFLDGKENEEETFAGVKDYLSREKPAAITSAKGTIRGVKNRVKAGIATFLQMHENKSYKDRDAGKVVVYTTTMGIVRETYHKCLKVKQILKTLMVKFEERDVFMSIEAQQEIRDRMKCNIILVPQVFVEGQHIGDAETIERLNEIGELRIILKPYKSLDSCSTCNVCGGYRLLPCKVCKGSKKSIHRNHFTMEFVSLKCMNCDQVGLTKCNAC